MISARSTIGDHINRGSATVNMLSAPTEKEIVTAWPSGAEVLVSIACATFQHAAFVEKAIIGFLTQRTSFPFEIILHDDASTDGTAELVAHYASIYPRIIRCIRQDVNQYSQGIKPFSMLMVPMASGRYIAKCEGDDHWIDPLKLQKQVVALEADPGAVGCFTDAWNERDGQRTSYMDGIYAARPVHRRLQQREMLLGQNIPACTIMFRRDAIIPVPEQLSRSAVGDTVLYVHITRKGHLIYLPEYTAVRLMHEGGVHALKGERTKLGISARLYPVLDELTEGAYAREIASIMTETRFRLELLRLEEEHAVPGLHALLYAVDRNRRNEAAYVRDRQQALSEYLQKLGSVITRDMAAALLLLYGMWTDRPTAVHVRRLDRAIRQLYLANDRCQLVDPAILRQAIDDRWEKCFYMFADHSAGAAATHLLWSGRFDPARWRYLLAAAWRRFRASRS